MQLGIQAYSFYGELVLDLSQFDHPGTNKLLENYFKSDMQQAFVTKQHSMNAKLMVISLAVGKISEERG